MCEASSEPPSLGEDPGGPPGSFGHPETRGPLDRSRLLKRFKAAARRAQINEARFHDLRHTFGTRMAAAGVPLRTLQEWMGHRDFKTTLIYADYQPDAHERDLVRRAFAQGPNWGPKLKELSEPHRLKTAL